MTTFQAIGDDWVKADDHHHLKLVKANRQIVGAVMKHHVRGTEVWCDPGLIQWEPYGEYRPLFTLTSGPGEEISVAPFVVCEICGDTGYIRDGGWIDLNGQDTSEADVEQSMRVLEAVEGDDADETAFKPSVRRDLGDTVPEEEAEADRKVYDFMGGPDPVPAHLPDRFEDQEESLRKNILDEALGLICGDRNNSYGPPHQDFMRTAEMVTAMWRDKLKPGASIEAHDVAEFIMCVKLSHLQWSPNKRDNWTDIIGYGACGFEAYVLTHPDTEVK